MIPKEEIKIEYTKGKGPGGQHKNKTSSCVKMTHIPTGITVTIDGRHQGRNKKKAFREMEDRLLQLKLDQQAGKKKARRDRVIHERNVVRTYDYSRGLVTDHRTNKTASIKEIMIKAKLDKLR